MSGIDVNRFVDLPELLVKHLKCSICLNIYFNPMDTQCKHTFCMHCIQTSIENNGKTCPQCRQSLITRKRPNSGSDSVIIENNVMLEKNRSLDNIINDLKIKCDFEAKGCQEVIEFGLMSSHLNACPFRLCSICGLLRGDESQHNCIDLLKTSNNELKQKSEELVKELEMKNNMISEMNERINGLNDCSVCGHHLIRGEEHKCVERRLKRQIIKMRQQFINKNFDLEKKCKERVEKLEKELQNKNQIIFNQNNELNDNMNNTSNDDIVVSNEYFIDESIFYIELSAIPAIVCPDYAMFGTYRSKPISVEFNESGLKIAFKIRNNLIEKVYKLMIRFYEIQEFMYCLDPTLPLIAIKPTQRSNHKMSSFLCSLNQSRDGFKFDIQSKDKRKHFLIIVLKHKICDQFVEDLERIFSENDYLYSCAPIGQYMARLLLDRSQQTLK